MAGGPSKMPLEREVVACSADKESGSE
jgi:hypothetical protein